MHTWSDAYICNWSNIAFAKAVFLPHQEYRFYWRSISSQFSFYMSGYTNFMSLSKMGPHQQQTRGTRVYIVQCILLQKGPSESQVQVITININVRIVLRVYEYGLCLVKQVYQVIRFMIVKQVCLQGLLSSAETLNPSKEMIDKGSNYKSTTFSRSRVFDDIAMPRTV